ncbi:mediator of RNA polymerase II transcription subunit 20-like isoform X2 [Lytechinus pictus]|uniref:mediator of RNA polymerase II transcription subunit 20-like isoform X2 n=1 Tax=Lytechinus pictus TaxID=7653 RepID=UPI0030B9F22D
MCHRSHRSRVLWTPEVRSSHSRPTSQKSTAKRGSWCEVLTSQYVVTQWPVTDNRTVPQAVEVLTKRLDAFGATKTGNFGVDCETYQSVPTNVPPKYIHVMHNKEQPYTCYAVTDNRTCLVCENSFEAIMHRLNGFYVPKKTARIESKGTRYEMGDFIVKIGIVSLGPHARGVLVEVEYTPCVMIQDCWPLMVEFMQGFMGAQYTPSQPPTLIAKPEVPFSAEDTVFQYLEQFETFVRRGSSTATVR